MPAEDASIDNQVPDAPVDSPASEPSAAEPKTDAEAASAGSERASPQGDDKPKEGEDAAPKTALDAAKRVMAKEQRDGSAKSQEGAQAPKAEGDKPTTVEDERGQTKAQIRWDAFKKANPELAREISSENRILRKAKETNEAAIKALEPKAKAHDSLVEFFNTNALSQQEVAQGFSIMAAMKGDPAEAYRMLKPLVEELESKVGVVIPEDIRAKIEAGVVDEATGRELAKQRADARLAQERAAALEARNARTRQDQERQSQEAQEEAMMKAVVDALNASESEWAKSDPDAAKLKPLLEDAVMVMGQRKPPHNAEEAKQLFRDALSEVRKRVSTFSPVRQEKSGNLPVSGASKPVAQVPQNALEAAEAALAAMR